MADAAVAARPRALPRALLRARPRAPRLARPRAVSHLGTIDDTLSLSLACWVSKSASTRDI